VNGFFNRVWDDAICILQPHCETCEKVENAAIKILLKLNENENVPTEANLGEIDGVRGADISIQKGRVG
jgi:hypothetical protein